MAQGKKIGVQFSDLRNVSGKMSQYSDDYTQIYRSMYSAVDSMNGFWTGTDYMAFKDQMDGFLEDLQNMAKKLQIASESLAKQTTQYEERQNHIATEVRKLRN